MITNFIKKTGMVANDIARDFFLLDIGSKIATIDEYTNRFSTSRGLVQNAISLLESSNCVQLKKAGKLGTTLVAKDMALLAQYADWESIHASMPLPSNNYLRSLASAVCHEMRKAQLPFNFAYMTGSDNRINRLRKGIVDFIIVSKTTADLYLDKYDDIEEVFTADTCSYSQSYNIYFGNRAESKIRNNMRIAVDRSCADVVMFTDIECQGLNVHYIDIPYTRVAQALIEGVVDCAIYRAEEFMSGDKFAKVPLRNASDNNPYPTVLANVNNYRMADYLRKYLNIKQLGDMQKKYITNQIPQFYY